MSKGRSSGALTIDVVVADPTLESPPFRAATDHLGHFLGKVLDGRPDICLDFKSGVALEAPDGDQRIVIISLLGDLDRRDAPLADIAADYHRQVAALAAAGPVFICTIFRHVPPAIDRAWTIERIRRLNLLALQLSQGTGAGIIDIDRTLADLGARSLQTDYLLTGPLGPYVAGDVVAMALLTAGLDDVFDVALLEKALAAHGGAAGIARRADAKRLQPESANGLHASA